MKSILSIFLFAIVLAGCQQQSPQPLPETSLPAKKVQDATPRISLEHILSCQDWPFLALPVADQLNTLQANPDWHCALEPMHPDRIECKPNGGVKWHGFPVWMMNFGRNEVWTSFDEHTSYDEIAEGVPKRLHLPPDNDDDLMSSRWVLGQNGDGRDRLLKIGPSVKIGPLVSCELGPAGTDADPPAPLQERALLQGIARCQADHFLSLTLAEQRQALIDAGASCVDSEMDSVNISQCAFAAPISGFAGASVNGVLLEQNESFHAASVSYPLAFETLRGAIQEAWRMEPQILGESESYRYRQGIDDRYFLEAPWVDAGDAPLRCIFAPAGDEPPVNELTPLPTQSSWSARSTGSIAGKIIYPAETPPGMRVCAVSADYRNTQFACTQTEPGDRTYRVESLFAPLDYFVIAWLREGDIVNGAHVEAKTCGDKPCDVLKKVHVPESGALEGIDLEGFYSEGEREDLPLAPPADEL